MNNIRILDCTLRDGGYVNNWNFKENNIKFIIEHLVQSGCDYIECGFLKKLQYDKDKSLFNSFVQLENILPNTDKTKFTLMINYGEVSIEDIPYCNTKINLRIVFKKEKRNEAIEYCKKLVAKGYSIFVNPMNSNTYSSAEFLDLINKVNEINPVGFTIVDTTGAMSKKDTLALYYLIENNLNKNIALCFHSHNNLQLSFSNAQVLMEQNTDRTIIIDSTVFGIGRGAGNLCTELLVKYINDNHNGNYELIPILKIIDEQIAKIFAVSPWGYSVPYYIAASMHCHPNYAKYLIDKQTVPVELITQILSKIPYDKRGTYDVTTVEELYYETLNYVVDDTDAIEKLTKVLKGKEILILASGKSIVDEEEKIYNFIKKEKPFIISLNYIPQQYNPNIVFITNIKRYNSIGEINIPCITTSNVKQDSDYKLNYLSYVDESSIGDNVALILFRLFMKIGIKKISIAGFDGYSIKSQNYADVDLINIESINDITIKNQKIRHYLESIKDKLHINFVTKSIYNK